MAELLDKLHISVLLLAELGLIFLVIISAWAIIHVIMYKRDSRSAASWLAVIILSPLFGAILYYLFGVNRIQRKASQLKRDRFFLSWLKPELGDTEYIRKRISYALPRKMPHNILDLIRSGDAVLATPLVPGNCVTVLENEAAFAAMLRGIRRAKKTITLQTYIFDNDRIGKLFVAALAEAVKRGVLVRVLIDNVGAHYSKPTIGMLLKEKKIPHAFFMKANMPISLLFYNLRSHRKIMAVDGQEAYIGGANIREQTGADGKVKLKDIHFMFRGPIASEFQKVFAEDWEFTTHEQLNGKGWVLPVKRKGTVHVRPVPGGPDRNLEKNMWVMMNAIANARKSIHIQTPYFIPDPQVISALSLAALQGIEVKILVPHSGNLKYVQWAMDGTLWRVIEKGCRVYRYDGVFDHSKIMTVDGLWSYVGSSNWDARSMRLNFEFDAECYDKELAHELDKIFLRKVADAHELTLVKSRSGPFIKRFRNNIARLFSPYL
ncbi:MAG: cardiolipin synthase [Candidatus Goldiibacteriota bacterium HGW-Goldbacteria-1]|jgi:cardiolipin synthase|nr:MAG: cardiolipin synthase [Candidatus Goldiibacteriota bacterium HGW-Goldbacteria-1]